VTLDAEEEDRHGGTGINSVQGTPGIHKGGHKAQPQGGGKLRSSSSRHGHINPLYRWGIAAQVEKWCFICCAAVFIVSFGGLQNHDHTLTFLSCFACRVLGHRSSGQNFGEMGCLLDLQRSATIVAVQVRHTGAGNATARNLHLHKETCAAAAAAETPAPDLWFYPELLVPVDFCCSHPPGSGLFLTLLSFVLCMQFTETYSLSRSDLGHILQQWPELAGEMEAMGGWGEWGAGLCTGGNMLG
jgi:hypothetical protein